MTQLLPVATDFVAAAGLGPCGLILSRQIHICQKYACCNRTFVMTNIILSRQKLLSQQAYFCRDKRCVLLRQIQYLQQLLPMKDGYLAVHSHSTHRSGWGKEGTYIGQIHDFKYPQHGREKWKEENGVGWVHDCISQSPQEWLGEGANIYRTDP